MKKGSFLPTPRKKEHIAKHRVCIYTGFVFNILINYFTDRITFVSHFGALLALILLLSVGSVSPSLWILHSCFWLIAELAERSECNIILSLIGFNAKADWAGGPNCETKMLRCIERLFRLFFDEGKLYPLPQKFNINIQTTCTEALDYSNVSRWPPRNFGSNIYNPFSMKIPAIFWRKKIHPFSILQSSRWLIHFFAMFVFILTISVWLSAFFYWPYTLVWLLFILLTFFMGLSFVAMRNRKKKSHQNENIFSTHIRTRYFSLTFFMKVMDEWNEGNFFHSDMTGRSYHICIVMFSGICLKT